MLWHRKNKISVNILTNINNTVFTLHMYKEKTAERGGAKLERNLFDNDYLRIVATIKIK